MTALCSVKFYDAINLHSNLQSHPPDASHRSLKMCSMPVDFAASYALLKVVMSEEYILRDKFLYIFFFYVSGLVVAEWTPRKYSFSMEWIYFMDFLKLFLKCIRMKEKYRNWERVF